MGGWETCGKRAAGDLTTRLPTARLGARKLSTPSAPKKELAIYLHIILHSPVGLRLAQRAELLFLQPSPNALVRRACP